MRWARAVIAGGLVAVSFVGYSIWRASRALGHAESTVAEESRIAFTERPLDGVLPAGFESISSPAAFTDAALFQNRMHLCGPGGLQVDAARFRPGFELPPAPLVAMTPAITAGAPEEELFLATKGQGLLAFDGRRFRQILPKDFGLRRLTAVLGVQTGRILLGTEKGGVLVYDGRRLEWFHPSLQGIPVTALAGSDIDLWVGTQDRGLLHWNAGRLDRFSEPEGLPDARVLSLAVHGDSVYAGTALGAVEFRGGRFARVLANGFFAQTLLADDSGLAVGTLEEGILSVGRKKALPACEDCGSIRKLLEVEGRVFAVADNGTYSAETGVWKKISQTESAPMTDRNVSALATDGAGRLWVGYFDRGLDVFEPGGRRSAHVENEHVFCVNRIVPDPQSGNTAVGTANGLVMFDVAARQRQVLRREEGLIANHVADILFQPGGMTVATSGGLTLFDGTGARSLYAFHGLVNNHAYALAASGGTRMVGTLGGMSMLDSAGAVRASFTVANSGLKHNWITALAAAGGDWYVGTYGAGVMKLDASGRWEQFEGMKAPFIVNPAAMIVSGDRIYAGLLDRGLGIFQLASGRWTVWTAGLPSLNVTALAARDGLLYIGADNGLVRVREEALRVQ